MFVAGPVGFEPTIPFVVRTGDTSRFPPLHVLSSLMLTKQIALRELLRV